MDAQRARRRGLPLLLLAGVTVGAAYRPLVEVVVAAVGMAVILVVVLVGGAATASAHPSCS